MRARRAEDVRPAIRRGLTVACGVAWWWAALRFALAPDARPGLGESAALTGWSLGLIPLHAVPAYPRAQVARGSRRLPGLRGLRRRAADPSAPAGPAGQEPDGTGPR